ncbi:high affinity cationic amino acid transporter 1-like [Tubulanus polymorphus]|uniref:high affinity cationic amino acid transporter 1-like n=1 Tax=Tubulanus polymorphus TaxID=672921 RepID=UPI003DA3CD46
MCLSSQLRALRSLFSTIANRRKLIVPEEADHILQKNEGEKLDKCLNLFDLVMLGTGSCLGSGMYIVVGFVAKDIAGPGVVLSFLIGGFASFLSGICYAEFGCRVPKTAGGAYVYSYVTVGELIAFVTGWNLILEYMIGTASGAIGISALINTLSNGKIAEYMTQHTFPVIGRAYPDFIAFGIGLMMTAVLAMGVKSSVKFNNALNVINLVVWVFAIVTGAFYAVPSMWWQHGFLPYGMSGVFSGAATCFYAFIGFDLLATTGEETRNAGRVIPIAVVLTLVICLTVYVTVSVIVTLMVPYFDVVTNSALISVFKQRHVPGAEYVVTGGALCGLIVSLLGSAFPMPRIIYAMGSDGVLFTFLSKITPSTKTPLVATIISGVMAALLSLIIGLKALIEMMSIGTLLAYSMVSLSILILRYRPHEEDIEMQVTTTTLPVTDDREKDVESRDVINTNRDVINNTEKVLDAKTRVVKYETERPPTPFDPPLKQNSLNSNGYIAESPEPEMMSQYQHDFTASTGSYEYERFGDDDEDIDDSKASYWFESLRPYFDNKRSTVATDHSSYRVSRVIWVYLAVILALCLLLVLGEEILISGVLWIYFVIAALVIICLLLMLSLWCQPVSRKTCNFMTPALPFLPCCALFVNVYLMLKLSPFTWVRFIVWMTIGFGIYFTYGVKTAEKIYKEREEVLELLSKNTHHKSSISGSKSDKPDDITDDLR